MAVLSSLVVQLALESASFQQGLRSARTELKTFSREAGQAAYSAPSARGPVAPSAALAGGPGAEPQAPRRRTAAGAVVVNVNVAEGVVANEAAMDQLAQTIGRRVAAGSRRARAVPGFVTS